MQDQDSHQNSAKRPTQKNIRCDIRSLGRHELPPCGAQASKMGNPWRFTSGSSNEKKG